MLVKEITLNTSYLVYNELVCEGSIDVCLGCLLEDVRPYI